MAAATTYWVEAASGLHRHLRVTTSHTDTRSVRAAVVDAVAVHDVPCGAEGHEVSLRKQPVGGWKVTLRCHNDWAETVHRPTVGRLVPVPVYEFPGWYHRQDRSRSGRRPPVVLGVAVGAAPGEFALT